MFRKNKHYLPPHALNGLDGGVVIVLDGPKRGLVFSSRDREQISAAGCSVVFRYKHDMQASLDHDPAWKNLNPLAINHVDRPNDDELYGRAQDAARDVLNSLLPALPEEFRGIAERFKEEISLSGGDYYVQIFGVIDEINSVLNLGSVKKLIIISADVRSAIAFRDVMQGVGHDCHAFVRYAPNRNNLMRYIRRAVASPDFLLNAALSIVYRIVRIFTSTAVQKAEFGSSEVLTADDAPPSPVIARVSPDNIQDIRRDEWLKAARAGDVLCFFVETSAAYRKTVGEIVSKSETRFTLVHGAVAEVDWVEPFCETYAIDRERHGFTGVSVSDFRFSEAKAACLQEAVLAFLSSPERVRAAAMAANLPENLLLAGMHSLGNQVACVCNAYAFFEDILSETRPKSVLLAPPRSLVAQVLRCAAQDLGIPVFDLSIGTLTKSRRQWRSKSDYIFLSDISARSVQETFFDQRPERLLLVGSPQIDASVASVGKLPDTVEPNTIFLALQHLGLDLNRALMSCCAEVAETIGGRVTVGIHPREIESNRKLLLAHAAELGDRVRIAAGPSLQELVHHEVCVTFFSFLAFEAFALGKRVIAVNLTGNDWPMRLGETGIADEAYSAADVTRLLGERNGEREGVADLAVFKDGKSVERILTALTTLGPSARSDAA